MQKYLLKIDDYELVVSGSYVLRWNDLVNHTEYPVQDVRLEAYLTEQTGSPNPTEQQIRNARKYPEINDDVLLRKDKQRMLLTELFDIIEIGNGTLPHKP